MSSTKARENPWNVRLYDCAIEWREINFCFKKFPQKYFFFTISKSSIFSHNFERYEKNPLFDTLK
jgi:hypothetical protein